MLEKAALTEHDLENRGALALMKRLEDANDGNITIS